MTRVGIVLPAHWGASRGGAEYQAHCLAEYLAAAGLDVTYLARAVPAAWDCSYRIRGFSGPRLLASLRWGYAPDWPGLHRALAEADPEVVIQMVAGAYTGMVAYFTRSRSRRMIWYVASDRDVEPRPNLGVRTAARHLDRLLFRYGVRRADCIVAQTRRQAERMRVTLGRTAVAVVPNFHPVPDLVPGPSGKFTVVWVGSMKPLKRPELFVRLASELEGPDMSFCIIGRHDGGTWGSALAAAIGEVDGLEYPGELELDEVNRRVARAHVLVNTSEYEGFPNTFIQAWMRGVPTVSINVDPDGVMAANGIGFCESDFQGLKARVLQLYRDPGQRDEMGRRARAFAVRHYSMENAERIRRLIVCGGGPE